MSSVLLLRHGETDWNRQGRMQGRGDSPLTLRGAAQADALARAAALLGVRRVLASPLGRARATAERVAVAAGCPRELRDALVEMDFGQLAGLTLDEVREKRPGLLEAREDDRWNHRWPGGESYADVLERLETGLADDLPLRTRGPTAIVAHQSVNRALLAWLASAPGAALAGTQPPNVILRVDEDGCVWHMRVCEGPHAPMLDWWAGPFRRAVAPVRARMKKAA